MSDCDHVVGLKRSDFLHGEFVSERLVLDSEDKADIDEKFQFCPICGASLESIGG